MRRYTKALLALTLVISLNASKNHNKGKTFFRPRNITTDSTFEHTLTDYYWYHPFCNDTCDSRINLYFQPFVMKSTNKKDLAKYFLPNEKSQIEVKQDGTGDVGSLWLNIINENDVDEPFSSTVRVRPERTASGIYFNSYFDLSRCADRKWWASVTMALVHAKHNLHFKETNVQNPGTIPNFANATEALNNADWQAGKWPTKARKRTRLDDVQIRIGRTWLFCDYNHLAVYGLFTVPTGNTPNIEYIFDPVIGSKSWSVGGGLNGDYLAWENCDKTAKLRLLADVKYRYLLKGTERRSFDLTPNGDWSRYLLVVPEDERKNTMPGINLLTRDAKVTPGSRLNLWTAFHYQKCYFHLEGGYNLWWAGKEKVRLACPFPNESKGIFDLRGDCGNINNPISASQANISESVIEPNPAPRDQEFTYITGKDLNLSSAAHPNVVTHKLFLAGAYELCHCYSSTLLGLAASYEFGSKKKAFNQWALWATAAISF